MPATWRDPPEQPFGSPFSMDDLLARMIHKHLVPYVEHAAGTVTFPLCTYDEALSYVVSGALFWAREYGWQDLRGVRGICRRLLDAAVAELDDEHQRLYWTLRDEALLAFSHGYDKRVVAHGTARLVAYPFPPALVAHAVQRAAREHAWATRDRKRGA